MHRPLILFLAFLLGCQSFPFHGDSEDENAGVPSLIGHWLWIQSEGGFAYRKLTPATEHYAQTLIISPDSTFTLYRSDTIAFQDHFHLIPGTSIFTEGATRLIHFDHRSVDLSFQVNASSLTLSDECYDCYTSKYVRLP